MYRLAAIDIETRSTTEDPDDALVAHLSEITVIGFYSQDIDGNPITHTFRGPDAIDALVYAIEDYNIVGHNLKFDLMKLCYDAPQYADYFKERWIHDTQLMAHNYPEKVIDNFLAQYELARKVENDKLPKGVSHRNAGALSLKTLAPYFLEVRAFWEDPSNHDNDEYVLKDCEYTYKLCQFFLKGFTTKYQDAYAFYQECQLPWTKNLLETELIGFYIDKDVMSTIKYDVTTDLSEAQFELDVLWAEDIKKIEEASKEKIRQEYQAKAQQYIQTRLKDKKKIPAVLARYETMCMNQLKDESNWKFSMDSSKQLLSFMRDVKGYDMSDMNGKPSTGKAVLQHLANEGSKDAELLLKIRKSKKLLSSYFPTYEHLIRKQTTTLHPSYNPTGARTGRLSCSLPNMQQVAPKLKPMFVARPGKTLITKDLSGLEPVLIAYFAADPMLMKIVQEGLSFHCVNTKAVFGLKDIPIERIKDEYAKERKIAKEFGLSVLYGAGAKMVQQSFRKHGVERSLDECKKYVQAIRDTYYKVWEFKTQLDEMLEAGDLVYNYMGRPIVIANKEDVYMKGFNRLIQGSGSDILQQAAYDITRDTSVKMNVLALVHDELVVEVNERDAEKAEERITFHMTKWDLTNEIGTVRLGVEGKVDKQWSK